MQGLEDDVHDIQRAGMFMAAGGVRRLLGLLDSAKMGMPWKTLAAKVLGSSVQRCAGQRIRYSRF